ncbi:Partial AB-hydrolase lipase domain-containing protein [Caenorhabditis elegans]|uniref:Partial AB-hydrolase lipase domain-containing protein n=1 Tax=Caenorhabditis elegans TaxID=6239 RepID=E2S7J2_CAEEL|nr:Partial AB-hydrolase lipase domain-containing protein [Caenorhabditis elegans]CCD72909.2 Partial AB-hydrolase lipase domain-containing protein [Caenorhabditis elegans]|eukprot:NP_504755.3 LIPase Like [Caenorhabditis elegans]
MKSLLLLFLLFLHTLCENVTTPNSEEDTDMTATPSTITPLLSTAQNPSLPKTSKLPLALKTPVPTFPFSSLATSDWLSSMPTIQTLLPPPLPLTTLEVPENENFGFTSLAPLWTLPTQPPAWSPMLDSPIKPIQNSMFPTFPTMPTLPTLPTLAPFTFPTLPPPTTMKPLNITIDPEALMDVPEIITHWGYPVETHKVVTVDGYILTLHRIPHGKNETSKSASKTPKPVVFLQHGLLCTSSIWLLNLPRQSAGYIFADQGYDVWLGNMRGNTYSKEHTRMTSADRRFWKFSWEEMARYDLPAMINYALKTTKRQNLYYVGHSQGALTMFAKMSEDPEMSKKIRKFFAMAPVARMSHVKGLFQNLGQIYEQYNLVYQVFGDGEFLTNNIFTKLLTDIFCDQAVNNPLCENFIFAVSGPNSNQFNNSRIGIYLAHNPAGTSSRNILHFAQMVKKKRMSRFDHGKDLNLKIYGAPSPPEYDIRKINSSIYLFYSDFDWLANPKDVEGFLIPMLPSKTLKKATKLRDFNHNDFLWGMRARKEIYDKIINTIKLDQRRVKLQNSMERFFERQSRNSTSGLDEETMMRLRNETMNLD